MNRIIRYYNQNRRVIWSVIIIFAILILFKQTVNRKIKENKKNIITNSSMLNTTIDNNETNYAVITESTITEQTTNFNTQIIDSFIE